MRFKDLLCFNLMLFNLTILLFVQESRLLESWQGENLGLQIQGAERVGLTGEYKLSDRVSFSWGETQVIRGESPP